MKDESERRTPPRFARAPPFVLERGSGGMLVWQIPVNQTSDQPAIRRSTRPDNTLNGQMIMEFIEISIGATTGTRIILKPLVRSHADAVDYWDGNWIDSTVVVVAGDFRGEYGACLRAEEFISFRRDLERLHEELRGQGRFHSMEEWVSIDLAGDGRGHFSGICCLRDRAGDGNRLECQVEFDQSDIPAMLDDLRKIETAFPVLGDPATKLPLQQP